MTDDESDFKAAMMSAMVPIGEYIKKKLHAQDLKIEEQCRKIIDLEANAQIYRDSHEHTGDNLQNQLQELQGSIGQLDVVVNSMAEDVAVHDTQIAQLNQLQQELRARVDRRTTKVEVATLAATLDHLRTTHAGTQNRITELSQTLTSVRGQISRLIEAVTFHDPTFDLAVSAAPTSDLGLFESAAELHGEMLGSHDDDIGTSFYTPGSQSDSPSPALDGASSQPKSNYAAASQPISPTTARGLSTGMTTSIKPMVEIPSRPRQPESSKTQAAGIAQDHEKPRTVVTRFLHPPELIRSRATGSPATLRQDSPPTYRRGRLSMHPADVKTSRATTPFSSFVAGSDSEDDAEDLMQHQAAQSNQPQIRKDSIQSPIRSAVAIANELDAEMRDPEDAEVDGPEDSDTDDAGKSEVREDMEVDAPIDTGPVSSMEKDLVRNEWVAQGRPGTIDNFVRRKRASAVLNESSTQRTRDREPVNYKMPAPPKLRHERVKRTKRPVEASEHSPKSTTAAKKVKEKQSVADLLKTFQSK